MSLIKGLPIKDGRPILPQWRFRPIAALVQNNPVQNTWYEVLPVTGDAALALVSLEHQTAVNRDIEVRITSEGVAYTGTFVNAVTVTRYYAVLDPDADTLTLGVALALAGNLVWWPSQAVQVEIRTTDPGVNVLRGYVRYWSL